MVLSVGVFSCDFSGLELSYQGVTVKGNTLIIKDIVALGSLSSSVGKVVACCGFCPIIMSGVCIF